MIPLDQPQQLGEKAYVLMVSRRAMPGIVMLLVSAILLVLKSAIGSVVYSGFVTGGASGAATAALVSQIVIGTILTLFIVSFAVFLVGVIIARLEYQNYTYTFEEFDLRMRQGILHRTETSLPYRQIQDVDIDRTLMFQLLGLSKLTIITAGHEESDEHEKVEVILQPIEKGVAEDIRVMLERRIGVQVIKGVQEADTEMSPKASDGPDVTTTTE